LVTLVNSATGMSETLQRHNAAVPILSVVEFVRTGG
jgi:hypothetical protein